jgi:hypothetical protein
MFLYAFRNRADDFGIGSNQIVPAHAGLPRNAGRHDANVGTGNIVVFVGADHIAIEAFHRSRVREVERFPLRQTVDHIEQHNITQPLEQTEVGHGPADITGPN